MNSWIIIVDERRIGGMLNAVRNLEGQAVAVVIGSQALAQTAAKYSFDKIMFFAAAENVPREVYARQIAIKAKEEAPDVVIATDAPTARVILGTIARQLDAAVVSNVRALSKNGNVLTAVRSAVEGKVLEDIEISGKISAVFDGDDEDMSAEAAPAIENIVLDVPTADAKIVEKAGSSNEAGIENADRVIGVGMGVTAKDDLKMIEDLVAAADAEIACTLPICDDMRWFPSQRVIGSSHHQIAPQLYIAMGISGQPQHMSGIRDAQVIVAVNNDPDARIFKNCDYGIVGDFHKIAPALMEAFKHA